VSSRTGGRLADAACIGGIVAGIVLSYVTLAATPSLLRHHAVLLELVAGSIASMVTGGALARVGQASLAVVILAPLATIAIYDVFYWWAGHRFGNRVLAPWTRTQRARRRLARAERLVARWGAVALVLEYYLPVPNSVVQVLTGISGMSLRVFLLADIAGSLLWEGLIIGLGYAIGRPAVRVATAISHDALLATLGLVGVVIVVAAALRVRERRRGLGDGVTGKEQQEAAAGSTR
jgi:membrane-associated protein